MKERWTRLSWKQKEILLALFVVAGAGFIYSLAIKRTVELSEECTQIRSRIDSAALVNFEITELENELQQLEATGRTDSFITHEHLLDIIDTFCNGHSLEIRDYPPVRQFNRQGWNTELHEVTIAGSYRDMVLLLEFVHQLRHGQIASVTFYSKTDNKTKVKHLFVTIYIQKISKSVT